MKKTSLLTVLGAAAALLLPSTLLAASFTKEPTAVRNPNPAVPQAGVLTFSADEPVTTEVEVSDGKRVFTITFGPEKDPAKGLPIVGVYAGRKHDLKVSITGKDGKKVTSKATPSFTTPALPDADAAYSFNFPRGRVVTNKKEGLEPGFTVLSVRHEINTLPISRYEKPLGRYARFYGLLLGVDYDGEVVWYFKDDFRIAGVEQLANGNFLFNYVDFRTKEIDVLGNVVHEWYAADRPFGKPDNPDAIPVKGIMTVHHQPHEMPNGNFLGMSAQPRMIENYYTSEYDPKAPRATRQVMGDRLIEFDKQGNLVWSWETFDHLDPMHIGYELTFRYWINRGFPETLDWTHGNGSTYDPSDDSVIANFRNIDAVIKVDRKSGQIKWILSDPKNNWGDKYKDKLLTPDGPLRYPYHGHNPRILPDGSFIMYDNGSYQARPFDGRAVVDFPDYFSRAVIFKVDEKNMTVKQVWTSGDTRTPDSAGSWAMGDAHVLPGGNTFIVDSLVFPLEDENIAQHLTLLDPAPEGKITAGDVVSWTRVRQYNGKTQDVLWEYLLEDPLGVVSWQAFGGVHIKNFYEGPKH